jgi:hypothetical protein
MNLLRSVRSVCRQGNNLHATAYTPDDGSCKTETCVVVEEGRAVGAVKPESCTEECVHTYISSDKVV